MIYPPAVVNLCPSGHAINKMSLAEETVKQTFVHQNMLLVMRLELVL